MHDTRLKGQAQGQGAAGNNGAADLLAAALDYAAQGIPVFPLHTPLFHESGELLGCSCRKPDCGNIGKRPRTTHGLLDGTTDELVIRRWWKRWTHANIGLRTGVVLVGFDADHGQLGLAEAIEYGIDPAWLHDLTGDGRHYPFKLPDGIVMPNRAKNSGWPLEHCDARGRGGYLVAAPSRHPSGRLYTWSGVFNVATLPDVPEKLLEVWQLAKDDPRASEPGDDPSVDADADADDSEVTDN